MLRPGNSKRANAYAASVTSTSCATSTIVTSSMVLSEVARERRGVPGGGEVVERQRRAEARSASRTRPDGTPSTPRRAAAAPTARRAATRRRSRARARRRAARRRGSQALIGTLTVMRPALEEHELRERGRAEQHQQHHRQRGRVGRVPEAEADLVDVVEQQRRRVVGPAARHHDHVVDQPERVDHGVDQHEQRRRHQQRKRHAAEEVPARRAFDRRRLAPGAATSTAAPPGRRS